MKYLSWDIGIKNLSYCLMNENMEVLSWEILDISGEIKNENVCVAVQKNKKVCNKKACFYNLENKMFYCTKHSKDFKEDIIDVNKFKCCHRMENGKICGKKMSFATNVNFIGYCKTHSKNYENLKELKKDAKGTLDSTTINLINQLDNRSYLLDADVITIENQPAFKNPKMKSIQMIIYTYFNMRGRIDVSNPEKYIDRILFLSASNKLKVIFDEKQELTGKISTKNKYKKNKELAKIYCKHFLKEEKWINFFENHKKRDDLADTYLMNIYQIQIDNK